MTNREVYTRVYRDFPNYGNREIRVQLTREWIESFPDAHTLLDVGCGRGEVIEEASAMGIESRGCEIVPALCGDGYLPVDLIDSAAELPYPADAFDLVTCTDVVEHIPEEEIPAVLRELARVSMGPVLITACHRPDTPGKYGPDQLHITVKPREWWAQQILDHMGTVGVPLYLDRVNDNGTWFSVTP